MIIVNFELMLNLKLVSHKKITSTPSKALKNENSSHNWESVVMTSKLRLGGTPNQGKHLSMKEFVIFAMKINRRWIPCGHGLLSIPYPTQFLVWKPCIYNKLLWNERLWQIQIYHVIQSWWYRCMQSCHQFHQSSLGNS